MLLAGSSPRSPLLVRGIGAFAVLFGALTLITGGQVLFGSEAARGAAGAVVPFVLWFNFAAGFLYVIAGVGLMMLRPWSRVLSAAIVWASAAVLLALWAHILTGGDYETRTFAAMTLRTLVWIGIALVARRVVPPSRTI